MGDRPAPEIQRLPTRLSPLSTDQRHGQLEARGSLDVPVASPPPCQATSVADFAIVIPPVYRWRRSKVAQIVFPPWLS